MAEVSELVLRICT